MKIVIIHGQSHKGTSYHIGRKLTERLTTQDNITEFFLPKDMPEFCCGCYNCIIKGEEHCPHYGVLQPITESIEEADFLVFTTPVYCMRTTGSMKALLDHYFSRWMNHKPNEKMLYKRAVVISVGAGGGMKKAADDIVTSLNNWGIADVQSYRSASSAFSWNDVNEKKKTKIERDMDELADHIKRKKDKNKISIGTKFHFICMRMVQSKNWGIPQDKVYWEEKGWLGKKRPWKNGGQIE